ncbi:hypothetical protein [Nostoc sp. FACHB-133]|uniref:hypothetical protein n=1 Tax=Nostoc sp. FACHB-133 TaxID=2692835 RepID=UPI001687F3E2|nr:hypothetical protein [Nostoc sp. FACHB-133]MBD2527538.1 hypothetical protein [Nostoc sp. FACHB-133]
MTLKLNSLRLLQETLTRLEADSSAVDQIATQRVLPITSGGEFAASLSKSCE